MLWLKHIRAEERWSSPNKWVKWAKPQNIHLIMHLFWGKCSAHSASEMVDLAALLPRCSLNSWIMAAKSWVCRYPKAYYKHQIPFLSNLKCILPPIISCWELQLMLKAFQGVELGSCAHRSLVGVSRCCEGEWQNQLPNSMHEKDWGMYTKKLIPKEM